MSNKTTHDEYFYQTIYAVILIDKDGGQRMNFFNDEDKAREDADELITNIKKRGLKGYSVVLSPLEYSRRKNRIMTENFINEESEILYGKGRT